MINNCYSCGSDNIGWDEIPGRYEDRAKYIYVCLRCNLESRKCFSLGEAREAWQRKELNWTEIKGFHKLEEV